MPAMAVPLLSTQYATPHGEYYRCSQLPQPPPSPPMEDSRCSLPSISKLLGLADAGSPTSESCVTSPVESPRAEATGLPSQHGRQQEFPFDCRPNSSYAKLSQRGMPPTPPLGSDASFDSYSSPPSRHMTHFPSGFSTPGRFYETTPPLESEMRRHSAPCGPSGRAALQVPCPRQMFPVNSFATQTHIGSYYQSPLQTGAGPQAQISNLFYQQPLPQSFPPVSMPVMLGAGAGNPWQHHHYLTPSHGASYPQSQDRYICQTCNKAFSRPSSLRIHSHSHTGEKPFKCPHAGCGKAFSVRSNMKRHERGCHSFEVNPGRAVGG